VPLSEACPAERKLHLALLNDPREPVAASQVAAIADPDARENWQMMIAWRDHLTKHRTLEAAYLEMIRRNIKFPHVLIGQLVQAILRNNQRAKLGYAKGWRSSPTCAESYPDYKQINALAKKLALHFGAGRIRRCV
jgi:hypothetical protein